MTVKTFRDFGVEALLPLYSKEEAKGLIGAILEQFCHIPTHTCYSDPHRPLSKETLPNLLNALADLLQYRPIQYVLGQTLFERAILKVKEGVLIPRSETAELVRWAAEKITPLYNNPSSFSLLDLCTGSGAIAISLAQLFPNVKVYGVDVSELALQIAHENALLNKVKISLYKANILLPPHLSECPLMPHSLDMMISNPPYVRLSEKDNMERNVLDYEPHLALFVPDEEPLLFYNAITDWSQTLLKDGGILMVEINEQMDREIIELLLCRGFSSIEIRKDVQVKPRMCYAVKSFSKRQSFHSRPCQYP